MALTRVIAVICAAIVTYAPLVLSDELVPYQSDGWRYMQVSWSDPLHDQFYQLQFDDAGWPVGQAGFGRDGCPIQLNGHTGWSVNTDMLLRRHFSADRTVPVTVYVAIDNDVTVYVNGVLVGSCVTEGCAFADRCTFPVPQDVLFQGSNLLAVVAHDRGVEAYVDVRVEGETPVATEPVTWGGIKAVYR